MLRVKLECNPALSWEGLKDMRPTAEPLASVGYVSAYRALGIANLICAHPC